MASMDVTVLGAGIFGLAIAWEMTDRGARVRVVDPGGPGAGASGGVVGALAPHVPENWNAKKTFQLDALLAQPALWAAVAEASGMDPGYRRTGRLQPLGDAAAVALARSRVDGARAHWGDRATWEVTASPGGFAPPAPTGLVLRDTLSAHLHPARAIAALAAALRARGVEIARDAPEKGAVVWATGAAGLTALSEDLGRVVGVAVKGQAAVLGHDAGPDAPQVFADGLHIVPHGDGTVAVGATTERDFEGTGTDGLLDDVVGRARAAMPMLAAAPVVAQWAGLRPRARSRAPMLGRWPGRPGHFVANGGFKIGFGVAPGVARVMADLVLDGADGVPDGFRVEDNL